MPGKKRGRGVKKYWMPDVGMSNPRLPDMLSGMGMGQPFNGAAFDQAEQYARNANAQAGPAIDAAMNQSGASIRQIQAQLQAQQNALRTLLDQRIADEQKQIATSGQAATQDMAQFGPNVAPSLAGDVAGALAGRQADATNNASIDRSIMDQIGANNQLSMADRLQSGELIRQSGKTTASTNLADRLMEIGFGRAQAQQEHQQNEQARLDDLMMDMKEREDEDRLSTQENEKLDRQAQAQAFSEVASAVQSGEISVFEALREIHKNRDAYEEGGVFFDGKVNVNKLVRQIQELTGKNYMDEARGGMNRERQPSSRRRDQGDPEAQRRRREEERRRRQGEKRAGYGLNSPAIGNLFSKFG